MENVFQSNESYSISVVLPVYNEECNIEETVVRVIRFLSEKKSVARYEIILVDDGSRDKTASILNYLKEKFSFIEVKTHEKNLGYGSSLITGIYSSRYPLIFVMDSDGQFSIDSLDKMLVYTREYDIVIGRRFKRRDNIYRVILGRVYSFLVFILFGLNYRDINCGFKLFKKEALGLKEIYKSKGGAFYAEVLLRARRKRYKIKEVQVMHSPRLKGRQTGANIKVMLMAALDLIRLKLCFADGQKNISCP